MMFFTPSHCCEASPGSITARIVTTPFVWSARRLAKWRAASDSGVPSAMTRNLRGFRLAPVCGAGSAPADDLSVSLMGRMLPPGKAAGKPAFFADYPAENDKNPPIFGDFPPSGDQAVGFLPPLKRRIPPHLALRVQLPPAARAWSRTRSA